MGVRSNVTWTDTMPDILPNSPPPSRFLRVKAGVRWAGASRTAIYEIASTEAGKGLLVSLGSMTFLDTEAWNRLLENAPKALVRSPSGRNREVRAQPSP
jgi:hypothetical protein